MKRFLAIAALLVLPIPSFAQAQATAEKARQILETNCFSCHGKDGSAEGGFDYILDVKKLVEKGKLLPKDADKSRILKRIKEGSMPPKDVKLRPSADDIAVLEKWIADGAPEPTIAPPTRKVSFLDEKYIYQAMYDHLFKNPADAKYRRFITLTHLANNPRVSEAELRYYRAGVVKLLNSLNWKKAVVKAEVVDASGAVLVIDLRDLDWDLIDGWSKLISRSGQPGKPGFHPGYQYALTHDEKPDDKELKTLAREVYKLAGTLVPAVRADWFLATASVPPLYHELLNLPDTLYPLEEKLRVDRTANFLRDRLARAGFTKSGVSAQANRLVERHDAAYGAYWLSYDFRSNEGTGNLTKFPLGPLNLFPIGKHPYPDQAFEHAGGEVIFNLPNGLQAYLLVDANGKRIDEGPADVVRDKQEFGGKSTIVVNGLSCMGCHQHGMIRDSVVDAIRNDFGGSQTATEKVRRLYPVQKEMEKLLEDDEKLFLEGLDRSIGAHLKTGPDKAKKITDFPEPITLLASPFIRGNVSVEEAAFELGITDPKELQIAIKNNARLRDELALKPWVNGNTIKRAEWQSVRRLTSTFQETAEALQRGAKIVNRRDR
ncbi:MAG TPA: c-type cytochrome domain-containing protein [Gemmata sp.]|jgi:serine/threonine-protein kinase|nr:c-type cytochrome domain-containing protein [Gemmata sp.]